MKRHTTRKKNRKARFTAIWWALMQLRYSGAKRGQTAKTVKRVKLILRKLRARRYEVQLMKLVGVAPDLAKYMAERVEQLENSLFDFQK
jgi:hypothetical protein